MIDIPQNLKSGWYETRDQALDKKTGFALCLISPAVFSILLQHNTVFAELSRSNACWVSSTLLLLLIKATADFAWVF